MVRNKLCLLPLVCVIFGCGAAAEMAEDIAKDAGVIETHMESVTDDVLPGLGESVQGLTEAAQAGNQASQEATAALAHIQNAAAYYDALVAGVMDLEPVKDTPEAAMVANAARDELTQAQARVTNVADLTEEATQGIVENALALTEAAEEIEATADSTAGVAGRIRGQAQQVADDIRAGQQFGHIVAGLVGGGNGLQPPRLNINFDPSRYLPQPEPEPEPQPAPVYREREPERDQQQQDRYSREDESEPDPSQKGGNGIGTTEVGVGLASLIALYGGKKYYDHKKGQPKPAGPGGFGPASLAAAATGQDVNRERMIGDLIQILKQKTRLSARQPAMAVPDDYQPRGGKVFSSADLDIPQGGNGGGA